MLSLFWYNAVLILARTHLAMQLGVRPGIALQFQRGRMVRLPNLTSDEVSEIRANVRNRYHQQRLD